MGLFGKADEGKKLPAPVPVERSSPPAARLAPPPPPPTVIGRQAVVKGEFISSENVLIEGRVEGKVKCDKTLVIGESGQVQAEVEAETVSIRGKLEGNCTATQKVEITGTGKVFGNIRAPVIAVAEGAVFRGASEMSRREEKPGRLEAKAEETSLPGARPQPEAGRV